VPDVTCSFCGERVSDERAIVGDAAAICPQCVWMCADILEERGEKRQELEFDDAETSQIIERGSLPPPKE
jgi:ATP-dependent protease Clp ATPase subunit